MKELLPIFPSSDSTDFEELNAVQMKVDDYKGTNFKATLISEFFMFWTPV